MKKIGRDLDALMAQAQEQGRPIRRVEQAQAAVSLVRAEIIESSEL